MIKKFILALAMATALGGLYGCSEGDNTTINIDIPTTTGGNNSTSSTCPSWASSRNKDADGNNVCQLPATISENRTLTADTVWFMGGTVTVGNGNGEMSATAGTLASGDAVQNVVLTIEPGTAVKGNSGSFANLVITRGSQIQANGTAAAPIVFSSSDAGEAGSGEWGGLIIHGYAPHNVCPSDNTMPCNIDAEGESGFAGGFNKADNSGTLRYVVVTEGGFEFATGNEINGISFVGVGSGTTVEFIQVDNNADDGVEFYGGNVNAKWVVISGAQDDSIDWDEGWQGNLQHLLVKQSTDSEGNAIEADTEGTPDTFLSKPTIANATFIGNGSKSTLAVFKKTSGGFLHNVVMTFDDAITASTTCVDDSAASDTLTFTNIVADCDASGASKSGAVVTPIADVQLDANYAAQNSAATGLTALDVAAFNAANSDSVADPAFFDATTYAGAVDPAATTFWFKGWTLGGL